MNILLIVLGVFFTLFVLAAISVDLCAWVIAVALKIGALAGAIYLAVLFWNAHVVMPEKKAIVFCDRVVMRDDGTRVCVPNKEGK